MKFNKFLFSIFLLLSLGFFLKTCEAVVYDGSTCNVYRSDDTIFRDGDFAIGSVAFRGGVTVLAETGVRLNLDVPIYNYLDLRSTGSMVLEGDLLLDSNVSFSSGGIIGLGGNSLLLNGDLQIPENSILEFASSGIFDGQGHNITLGKYAQLLVDGGVTVTFKNMTIKNTLNTISCPPIRCMDWYSQACFDNVIFAFNDDFAFGNGQFFIYNDVEFTGTSKFSYRSVRPSYITQHSNMIFDPQTIFEYYPSTIDNALIKMADKTSSIYFDGSTLQTTHTGLRLTKGSIYFDNKVTLSSVNNTVFVALGSETSVSFGDYARSVNWSPDRKYLAVGGDYNYNDFIIYGWNGTSLTVTTSKCFGITRSVNWSPDGKYLAVGGNNSSTDLIVYEWDGSTLTQKDTKDFGLGVYSVNWSPDGSYLAVGGAYDYNDFIIYGWNGTSLTVTTSKNFGNYVASVNWSPDGKYLAIGGVTSSDELIVYEWNGTALTQKDSLYFGVYVWSVNWSPDGKYLAVGFNSYYFSVYEWDGSTLTPKDTGSFQPEDFVYSVNWSFDGRYLSAGGYSEFGAQLLVYEWNGTALTQKYAKVFGGSVLSVNWSPDGKYLAVGGNNSSTDLIVYGVNYKYDTSPQAFSTGISFGNSALGASQDLDVYALAAARVGIYGKVWHDSLNSWNFQSRDSYVSLDRYDSQFRITNAESVSDWKKNQIIKSLEPNTLFLQDNQVWAASMDQLAPEETFEFVNNLEIPDGQITQFSTNVVIDGKGHDLILGKYAQLLVDGGVTVTFKNMTIRNTLNTISCPPIRCMDWYSQACFDNVIFAFNDDFAFRNGQFFIYSDVEFTGTSKFSYRSVRPSYITQHSNLIFNPLTTFEYYPSTTDNALIKMQDKTSSIIFDGSTLQTTHTGLRLTKGSMYFDNKVTLSSVNNTVFVALGSETSVSFGSIAYSVNWSPDGKYLAVGGTNGSTDLIVYEWNGSTLIQKDTKDFGSYANSVNWSPDGKYLAVGGSFSTTDLIVYEWDGSTLTQKDTKDFGSVANAVNWSPDGKYLAVGGTNGSTDLIVYEWNGSTLIQKDTKDFGNEANSANWSPDGRYLAVGGYNGSTDLIVYEWDGTSLTVMASKSFGSSAYSVNWSPDGKYLAVGGDNGSTDLIVYEWNGSALTEKDAKDFGIAYSVNWSPDGKYLAVGGGNGSTDLIVYEWNGSILTQKDTEDFSSDVYSVNWSPDGRYLAVGGNNGSSDLIVYGVNYKFDTSPQAYSNSIIFGNSALGADYDLDIYIFSDANVIVNGKVWYDDIN